jgi:SAM-dependent methyltransferase
MGPPALDVAITNLYRRVRTKLRPAAGVAERQPDEPGSPWWGEHLARYQFASQYVTPGIAALDIACGTGFGVRLLREKGAHVFGVDIDAEATRRAGQTTPRDRALVLRGNGLVLPFASGTFGLITSFETIEHLHERQAFAAELRRVLAPGGICLLSTPNAFYSRPVNGVPRNPFHLHEYQPDELGAELSLTFPNVRVLGQRLDGRYRVPPFWDDQQRLPRTPGAQAGLWTRRIMHRLPETARDRASQLLWGHQFFPTAADYHFDLAGIDQAQVLVAICQSA